MNIKLSKIVLTVLMLIIFSCQKESDTTNKLEDNNLEINIFETSTVKIDEIPEIELYIQSKSKKELFNKSNKNSDGPIFDLEHITQVLDTLGNKNYSFDFFFADSKPNEMYNLVVGLDSTGQKTAPVVFKYTCKTENMESWITNDYDFGHFSGTIDLHKFTDFFDDTTFLKSDCPPEHDDFGDPIPCIRENISSGGSGGSGGGSSGACQYNSFWSACGGSNQYMAHGSATCGGNGNGAGWVIEVTCPNGNNSTTVLKTSNSSDCPGCESGPSGGVSINTLAKPVQKLQYYLEDVLEDEELLWLARHQSEAERLVQFFLTEGRSDKTRATVLRALLTMTTGDYVVSISPLVRYPLGSDYASKYPKLTEYLKNQLPTLGENNTIVSAFKKYTNMTDAQVKEVLTWDVGPLIEIKQLGEISARFEERIQLS